MATMVGSGWRAPRDGLLWREESGEKTFEVGTAVLVLQHTHRKVGEARTTGDRNAPRLRVRCRLDRVLQLASCWWLLLHVGGWRPSGYPPWGSQSGVQPTPHWSTYCRMTALVPSSGRYQVTCLPARNMHTLNLIQMARACD
jgi:hypothetical protein